ncbi:MAG: cation:proton antiporter [Methanomassiliicoccales archaeon]
MSSPYTGIAIIFAVAAIVSIVFKRLRQPQILGYIIAGVLLAPFLKGETGIISLMSDMGITLLAFTMGMAMSLAKIEELGPRTAAGVMTELMIMLPAGFVIATLLGWNSSEALFFAAAFALTSTTIVSKTLLDTREMLKPYSEKILGLLVMEDLMTVVLLAVLSGIGSTGTFSTLMILELLGEIGLFMCASLLLSIGLLPRLINWVADNSGDEVLIIFSLGLCFALALFANELGFSFVIGAFVAGVAVAESGRKERIGQKLTPIKDVFLAVFFVSIGTLINLKEIPYLLPLAALIAFLFILCKFFSVTFGFSMSGFGLGESALTGIAAGALGEFSFVIGRLGIQYGIFPSSVFTLIVLVSVITVVTLPLSVKRGEEIVSFAQRHAPNWLTAYHLYFTHLRRARNPQVSKDPATRRLVAGIAMNVFIVLSILILTVVLSGTVGSTAAHLGAEFPLFMGGYIALMMLILYASHNTLAAEVVTYLCAQPWSYSVTEKLAKRVITASYVFLAFSIAAVSLRSLPAYTPAPFIVMIVAVAVVIMVLRSGVTALRIDLPLGTKMPQREITERKGN